MPVQFTEPPDTRAVGTGNPPADMNGVVDELRAAGATYNVLNAAYAGGADPTGALDSTAAINATVAAATAAKRPVTIPAGIYKTSSTLNWKIAGLVVTGDGSQSTIIQQVTANTPVVAVAGERQYISGLRIGYASQQANTSTSAICLQLGDDSVGNCFESHFLDLMLYQGAHGMRINPSLTSTAGVFSCQFDTIKVLGWSIRAIELDSAAGTGASNCTGCVFNNIYLHNNNTGPPSDSLLSPVFLHDWDEVLFNQLNIEHCNVFNTDVIQLQHVGNTVFNSLHLESIQLSGATGNSGYFAIGANTAVIVNGMSARFSTLTGSADNPVARFFGTNSKLILTGFNETSDVTVGGAGVHPWADFGSQANSGMRVSGIVAAQATSNQLNGTTGCWLQFGDSPLELSLAPAGAVAETFPRRLAANASAALTSGTLYVTLIKIAKGAAVRNLTFYTNTGVKAGGTHGWYVLLDSALKVLAVTADQTDAATVWGAASTAYQLPVTAPILAPYDGYYYAGVMVAAGTTMPTFTSGATPATGINGNAPIMGASSSTGQTTPPAVAATMGALTSVAGVQFYAYAS